MTLSYQLNRLNMINTNRDKSEEYLFHYNYYLIKECDDILRHHGYNTKTLRAKELKGRHINFLFQYWRQQTDNIVILKQKYNFLVWWANKVNNIGVMKDISIYLDSPFTKVTTTLERIEIKYWIYNHIHLPSDSCLECDTKLELTNNLYISYQCPICLKKVGVNHNGLPLGYIADSELREYRKKAHFYLDNLWHRKLIACPNLTKNQARRLAYKWLSEKLNISVHLCHIGFFDQKLCEMVCLICEPYFNHLNNN